MTHSRKIAAILSVLSALLFCSVLCGCESIPIKVDISGTESVSALSEPAAETVRIITTSDIHGKMLAYDYIFDRPDNSGSLAQISSAISEYRNENTILVNIGDSVMGNFSGIFVNEDIHPMVLGLNEIGFDICTAGNHEFNYGMDFVNNYINTCDCDFLLGNVYDENGALADAYTIIEKSGIRIAFIGMITPNITKWDGDNLEGYTVTDPADETNRIIDLIEAEAASGAIEPVDMFVGVYHMMEGDEYGVINSGFGSLAVSCPRLDLILGAHGHLLENKLLAGDIPVTENSDSGKTIQIADITFTKGSTEEGMPSSSVKDISTYYVETKDYPEDEKIVSLLSPYDLAAKDYAAAGPYSNIGTLEGGPLVPEGEISGVNAMLTEDTPLQSLIQKVLMYYANADAAISSPTGNDDNAFPGELSISDILQMYRYENNLYSVRMSGRQLKQYLEWSASFYQQYEDGDLIVAFENTPVYTLDTASGVNYDVDISKPCGERIVNLTYPDGSAVTDNDEFIVALCDYRFNTALSTPGIIFEEDDLPELIEANIRSDIGDIRYLIIDYIENVMGGTITDECDNNWKLIGYDWNEEDHKKAVELINNGTIELTAGSKNNPCIEKITVNDLEGK